ncbi:MAG: UdgX family uracil-DNA binding protein [Pseudomonadota bacterium]
MGVMNDPLTNDLFPQALLPVALQGATDLDGFRRASRALIARQMLPEQIVWSSGDESTQDLFGAHSRTGSNGERDTFHYLSPDEFAAAPALSVPPEFMTLCQAVILHSDPNRFGLLYRILWRLSHEPGLRHDPLDADIMKAQQMAHAVRRDMHKMKAFVRFRSVQDETFKTHPEGGPLHVAWFEPEHHIVEAVAPFFARRFAQMRWAILTPECSVAWNNPGAGLPPAKDAEAGRLPGLRFGPGASKQDAPPPDAGEQLWLTYYQHIFNPARLKVKMMHKEMPRKYWKNLPEAEMIQSLVAGAHESSTRMVEQPGSIPVRRIPIADVTHPPADAYTHEADGKPMRSLSAVRQAAEHCRECPIGECATQAVCGEGPLNASIMFVGEQPGDQEDLQGKPFVGPAGQLLNRALAELGIERDGVFVSNAVKHFKYELRGKRRIHKTPTQREMAACQHWLEDEIRIVKPGLLVALGATAARSLLGHAVPVMASRGKWFDRQDGLRVLVTVHPSALLRLPEEARDEAYGAWLADLAHLSG